MACMRFFRGGGSLLKWGGDSESAHSGQSLPPAAPTTQTLGPDTKTHGVDTAGPGTGSHLLPDTLAAPWPQ